MITLLIDTQSSDKVISKFDIIKKIWGEQYLNDFEVILTDNGKEFSNPERIEYFSDSQKINLFYCDPGKSYKKGKVEKNHEFIRYILPKGSSFNNLSQNDIDLMMSHINSVPRKELNKTSLIQLAKLLIGNDKIKKLNYKKIDGNEIILKPILLNK